MRESDDGWAVRSDVRARRSNHVTNGADYADLGRTAKYWWRAIPTSSLTWPGLHVTTSTACRMRTFGLRGRKPTESRSCDHAPAAEVLRDVPSLSRRSYRAWRAIRPELG